MLLPGTLLDTLLFLRALGSLIALLLLGVLLLVVLVLPLLLLSLLLLLRVLLVVLVPPLLLGMLLLVVAVLALLLLRMLLVVLVLPLLLLGVLFRLLLLGRLPLLLFGLGLLVLALLLGMVLLCALLLLLCVCRSSDSEKQRQNGCAGYSNHFHRVLPPELLVTYACSSAKRLPVVALTALPMVARDLRSSTLRFFCRPADSPCRRRPQWVCFSYRRSAGFLMVKTAQCEE
jgi:hypothetical protein